MSLSAGCLRRRWRNWCPRGKTLRPTTTAPSSPSITRWSRKSTKRYNRGALEEPTCPYLTPALPLSLWGAPGWGIDLVVDFHVVFNQGQSGKLPATVTFYTITTTLAINHVYAVYIWITLFKYSCVSIRRHQCGCLCPQKGDRERCLNCVHWDVS